MNSNQLQRSNPRTHKKHIFQGEMDLDLLFSVDIFYECGRNYFLGVFLCIEEN